jgi:hypothetical protein
VDFLRTRGDCWLGFLIDNDKEKAHGCVFGLSASDNKAHTIEAWAPGKPWRTYVEKKGSLPSGTWLSALVKVRAGHVQCFLNGQKLFEFERKFDTHATGCVGLRTWGGHYRFRNIKVTDPEGKVLLEGLPDLDSAWSAR